MEPTSFQIAGTPAGEPRESPALHFLKRYWPAVACGVFVLWALYSLIEIPVRLPPGVMAPDEPTQVDLKDMEEPPKPWQEGRFWIHPLASYRLEAKVLAKKRYRSGTEAELSPFDLALGWQQLSDQAVVDEISFSQSGRWYEFSVPAGGYSPELIQLKSANTHCLPGSPQVLEVLERVRRGDMVELEGFLVRVSDEASGWNWSSSLSRRDKGAHACEVFWIESAEITSP